MASTEINMGIQKITVGFIICIVYLIQVAFSQPEQATVLTCSSPSPQEISLSNIFQTFKYPASGIYPTLSDCRWLFNSPETDFLIRFRFSQLNVACGDPLKAYNGGSSSAPRLGNAQCSSTPNAEGGSFLTTQNNLYVDFTTDSSSGLTPPERGFVLEVIAGKDLSGCNQTVDTKTMSLENPYSLTSPLFPNNYPNDRTCTYTFTTPNDADKIQFNLVYMDVELFNGNCVDFVKLYDGDSTNSTVLQTFCGISSSVQSIESSGPSLTVQFSSDNEGRFGGFYADVLPFREETTTTTKDTTASEVTTNTNPEVTEGETECNRSFFSYVCCRPARLCNNSGIFCMTLAQCCKNCGFSSYSSKS